MERKYRFSEIVEYLSLNERNNFGNFPDEIEKWLVLLQKINPKHYKNIKKRGNNVEKMTELLAELATLYFFVDCLKIDINTVKLEPSGKDSKNVEFSYLENSKEFCVEVKCPSWKGQIWGNNKLTKDEKGYRCRYKKYRNESGFFDEDEELRIFCDYISSNTLKNAVKKFKSGSYNTVVIVPNLIMHIEIKNHVESIRKYFFEKISDEKIDTVNEIYIFDFLNQPLGNNKFDYSSFYRVYGKETFAK